MKDERLLLKYIPGFNGFFQKVPIITSSKSPNFMKLNNDDTRLVLSKLIDAENFKSIEQRVLEI